MGREINPITFCEMLTPMNAPMAMAMAELMSRLRRSTRCSKNDILPPGSCSGVDVDGSDCCVVIGRILVWRAYGFRRRLWQAGIGMRHMAGIAGCIDWPGLRRYRRFARYSSFRSRNGRDGGSLCGLRS